MDSFLRNKGMFRAGVGCVNSDYRGWFLRVFGFKSQFYLTDYCLRSLYLSYSEHDFIMPEWLIMLQRVILDTATREELFYYLFTYCDCSPLDGYSTKFLKDMVLKSIQKDFEVQ